MTATSRVPWRTNTVAKNRRIYVSPNLEVDTAVNTKSQRKENPEISEDNEMDNVTVTQA